VKHKTRGRKDHYLPRGYLKGFIDPAREHLDKPLWHLDLKEGLWTEVSPAEIAFEIGFYDYLGKDEKAQKADNSFAELERNYPLVRKQLIDAQFKNLSDHLEFLLHFMQMLRCRSHLYFEQKIAASKSQDYLEVLEVDRVNSSVKARPAVPDHAFHKNRALADMQAEIKKGADWLMTLHWAVRYTDSPNNPYVTSDEPFVVTGDGPDLNGFLQRQDTLLLFPICWQATLYGSPLPFLKGLDSSLPRDLWKFRTDYRMNSKRFIVSPSAIQDPPSW
jgi:hypothetical protein